MCLKQHGIMQSPVHTSEGSQWGQEQRHQRHPPCDARRGTGDLTRAREVWCCNILPTPCLTPNPTKSGTPLVSVYCMNLQEFYDPARYEFVEVRSVFWAPARSACVCACEIVCFTAFWFWLPRVHWVLRGINCRRFLAFRIKIKTEWMILLIFFEVSIGCIFLYLRCTNYIRKKFVMCIRMLKMHKLNILFHY